MTQDGSVVMSANHVGSQCSKFVWRQQVLAFPASTFECGQVTYPNTIWQHATCGPPINATYNVGYLTTDWTGELPSSGTYVGTAEGFFTSATGITNETDGGTVRDNNYSMQVNTNYFSTTMNGSITTGWEQFIFANGAGFSHTDSALLISYGLIGWYSAHSDSCPTSNSQYLVDKYPYTWKNVGDSCYNATYPTGQIPQVNPSNSYPFSDLLVQGVAGSSGDTATVCSNSCYLNKAPISVLGLYSSKWTDVEWNVFGNGYLHPTASFNSGTSLSIMVDLWDGSGNSIAYPVCYNTSWTAESNSLTLSTGCATYGGYYTFSESG